MNLRNVGGGLGGLVILAILFFVRMGVNSAKTEEFGQETKQEFLAELHRTEVCQGENLNFVDWLATNCHDEAWANNHELVPAGRRRTDVVIDGPGYAREMLSSMMDMARRENAQHIADGLGKVHTEWFAIE